MEAKPNERGVPGIDREERRYHQAASPDNSPITTRKTSVVPEEDWASLATGDPAFWLKERDQD